MGQKLKSIDIGNYHKHWLLWCLYFLVKVSQTLRRFLLCLCACMYKCITKTCGLYDSYLSFTIIAGSLWCCWSTLYLVHLDIIAMGIRWIRNKNLQVLIQELLMAQILNISPGVQSINTLVIRQAIATYENFSDGWLGTEIKRSTSGHPTMSSLSIQSLGGRDGMRFDWVAVQTSLSSHIMSCFSGHLSNISTGEEMYLNSIRKILE